MRQCLVRLDQGATICTLMRMVVILRMVQRLDELDVLSDTAKTSLPRTRSRNSYVAGASLESFCSVSAVLVSGSMLDLSPRLVIYLSVETAQV